jgi:hypothetical protein
MIKSIQQFQSKGVERLEKVFCSYADDLSKVAEMVYGVTEEMIRLGTSIIAEEWEYYDGLLHDNPSLRPDWYVIRKDEITRTTSLGDVRYKRTYFKHKKTGERSYLLDRLLGFEKGQRFTEDADARIFDEAADSSYRKGGINVSIDKNVDASKETVMDKLHPLKFPKVKPLKEKRSVPLLYIDADEDHVSLQYLDKKGDIKDPRSNTYMPKLVYVYEEVNADNDRHELVNVKYFGGGYEGAEGNKKLWDEVYEYIAESYDEEALERIYVNGDGADWIATGAKVHGKAKFVLDKYHMHKYILAATSHLGDSKEDARSEIWRAINGKRKWKAEEVFDLIIDLTESESKRKAVETSKKYILGHWAAIMNGVRNRKDKIHCSAEGHISHVYSDRMSSRPLGWSRVGADKMARLRVYKMNGGSMLELVRFQKEEMPVAAGAEDVIYSADQMLRFEAKNRKKLGSMADIPIYSIPYAQVKKKAAIKNHIWGL